jgi:uncharacterized protein YggU (UPF0235/DUF167 family)
VSAVLVVIVKPGSKAPGVIISGESVTVRVREPAVEGRASEAARRAIASALHVPQSTVTLIRGATSRYKSFAVAGLTNAEALRRLLNVGR